MPPTDLGDKNDQYNRPGTDCFLFSQFSLFSMCPFGGHDERQDSRKTACLNIWLNALIDVN